MNQRLQFRLADLLAATLLSCVLVACTSIRSYCQPVWFTEISGVVSVFVGILIHRRIYLTLGIWLCGVGLVLALFVSKRYVTGTEMVCNWL